MAKNINILGIVTTPTVVYAFIINFWKFYFLKLCYCLKYCLNNVKFEEILSKYNGQPF